uniref:Uncharacterized protein n=1 Tax=Salix viminalis TaxID=40686 RepID=A0A6N2MZ83_SALVM
MITTFEEVLLGCLLELFRKKLDSYIVGTMTLLLHEVKLCPRRFSDWGSCCGSLGELIVAFLMGFAIRNHLFTSRFHVKTWKMFSDWLLNKKGEAAGNDWNSI